MDDSATPKTLISLLTTENVNKFQESVNVAEIVHDLWVHKILSNQKSSFPEIRSAVPIGSSSVTKRLRETATTERENIIYSPEQIILREPSFKKTRTVQMPSRAEIESLAALSGATGG